MSSTNPELTIDRRAFLGSGFAGALGLALAGQVRPVWALPPGNGPAKACIFLWLGGGPSQFETFDPKPGAKTGGPTKAIETAVRGLRFAEHFPLLAKRAGDLGVIRSMTSKEGEHERAHYLLHTGHLKSATVDYPTLGSIVGAERAGRSAAVPAFVSLGSDPVGPGYLGTRTAGYVAEGDGDLLGRRVADARLRRRLKLLEMVEEPFAREAGLRPAGAAGTGSARTAAARAARGVLRGPLRDALDAERASKQLRRAYGRGEIGRRTLQAAQLVEAGVRCVEVVIDGWDDHEGIFRRLPRRARALDRAFATLVDDLKRRKRFDSTLIVCLGEFGRTPRINRNAGRDHWPYAFSAVLAGAGVKPGRVIGATSPDGKRVVERPVTVPDLFATVLTCMGIDPAKQHVANERPIRLVDKAGKPVRELLA